MVLFTRKVQLLFLSDFDGILIFQTDFGKIFYQIRDEILHAGVERDRRTDMTKLKPLYPILRTGLRTEFNDDSDTSSL